MTNRVVWCLTDGKPGHENQTRGLIASLRQRCPLDVHFIPALPAQRAALGWLRGRFSPDGSLPPPHLIIAAGHSTHLAALAARRAHGGRLLVLMRPSLPRGWFDLCLIPEHDLPVPSSTGNDKTEVTTNVADTNVAITNVISTRGVLNVVRPSSRQDDRRGLLLIGGPSKHHNWDERATTSHVLEIMRGEPAIEWTLTTSRRTPPSIVRRLQQQPIENLHLIPFEETQPGWVPAQLAAARTVFVSEDSVSMVYEALSAAADVGLLPVPRRRASRVIRGIDRLVEEQAVIPFDKWRTHRFEQREPVVLQEADRCARIVCERLLDAA